MIAARLGRPLSTCGAGCDGYTEAHTQWLYEQAVQHAFRLDPDILVRPKSWPSMLGSRLNILAGTALAYRQPAAVDLAPWALIGLFTRGILLMSPRRA